MTVVMNVGFSPYSTLTKDVVVWSSSHTRYMKINGQEALSKFHGVFLSNLVVLVQLEKKSSLES